MCCVLLGLFETFIVFILKKTRFYLGFSNDWNWYFEQ